MEKKRCKVVMLPTKHKNAAIGLNNYDDTLFDTENYSSNYTIYQHLYITSDDKIEAGDWCLFFWDGNKEGELGQIGSEPQQYFPENGHTLNKNLRKIIATTNPKLHSTRLKDCPINPEDNMVSVRGVSKPPKSFIEEYCRKGGIDEVDVEYGRTMDGTPTYNRLVVNSDNTINIHSIKDTYTEDEMIQFVLDNRFKIDSDTTRKDIKTWIR